MEEKTPQELFEEMATKGQHIFKDFSTTESQEMASQFMNAWNTIMTRSMENPEDWMKTVTGF